MAEVAKNVTEHNSTPKATDTSESKTASPGPMKQSKIGFMPRKKIVPSLVRNDNPTVNINDCEISKNSNDKSQVTAQGSDAKNDAAASKSSIPEENGGAELNGKTQTPKKSSGDSTKTRTPKKSSSDSTKTQTLKKSSSDSTKVNSPKDDEPLIKLKKDLKSKNGDDSKSSKLKDLLLKKDSGKTSKHDSKSKSSEKTSVKKSTTANKKTSAKKAVEIVKASDSKSSSKVTAPVQALITSKGQLNATVKGNKSAPVEIDDSSDDDEMPLSEMLKKCSPVKSKPLGAQQISALMGKTPVTGEKGQSKPGSQGKGKLDQTVQALYNRKVNGPIPNTLTIRPAPPPLHPAPTKNIIIAIDMDPKKWKSLSPAEQTRIIEHKKELARKHLLATNKLPPNSGVRLASPNHHASLPRMMNLHPRVPPGHSSHLYPANSIISPTSTVNMHANSRAYSSMNLVTHPHPTLPTNSYLIPRTPQFPTYATPRIGTHVGPMQQSHQFNNNFDFRQFNVKQEESTIHDLKPLPLSKKIPMPAGFPNELFGDVAMIVEFVNTFKKFLIQEVIKLDAVTLMIGVSPGGAKADVVAQILLMFLKILLSNEDYKVRGLKMELADMPLTEFTVSFLVCQLIRSQLETKKRIRREQMMAERAAKVAEKVADLDTYNIDSDSEADEEFDAALYIHSDDSDDGEKKKKKKKVGTKKSEVDLLEFNLNKIAGNLEKKEFWQLATPHQVVVLKFLVELILDSEDLQDYYDELVEDRHKAYRAIDENRKLRAKVRMDQAVITLDSFTKKEVPEKGKTDKADNEKTEDDKTNKKEGKEEEKEEEPDPYAGLTQRQKEAIQSEIDRNEEKKKDRERQDAEQIKANHEKSTAKLTSVIEQLRRCMRVEPLGEDRFHRLYWFFTNGIPGLYVSSLCVESIIPDPNRVGKPVESWSYYNKEEDINQLLCSLTVRGLREEKLKSRLRDQHVAIVKSIKEIKEIEMYKMIKRASEARKKRFEEKKRKIFASDGNKKEDISDDVKPICKENGKDVSDGTGEKVGSETVKPGDDEKKEDNRKPEHDGDKKAENDVDKKAENDGDKKAENDGDKKAENDGDKKAENDVDKKVENDGDKKAENDGDKKAENEGDKKAESEGDKKAESEGDKKAETDGDKKAENDIEIKAGNCEDKKTENGDKDVENSGDKRVENGEKKAENDEDQDKKKDDETKKDGDTKKEEDATDKEKDKKNESGEEKKSEEKIDVDNDDDEKIVDLIGKDSVNDDEPYDAHATSIDALKADIIESANRIVHGALGEIADLDLWSERVSSVDDVQGLKEFVLQIQSCIVSKFFLSPFRSPGDDISKDWCRWVERCNTLSTMHMLYGLLENSIKWEKSSEKMRCKVCRRKRGDSRQEQIIVCDGCHLGYHSHCLRPPLDFIPDGDWKCPSCAPKDDGKNAAKPTQKKRWKEEEKANSGEDGAEEEEAEEEGETDHEEVCHECESDGILILCDTCPLSFHLDCHKPPLHHAPRGNWSCYECTNPKKGKRGGGNKTKAKPPVKARVSKYVEYSSGHDDSSSNSSDEFVSSKKKRKKVAEPITKKTTNSKKNPPRKKRAVKNMEISSDDGSDDDADENRYSGSVPDDSDDSDVKPTKQKKSSRTNNKSNRPTRAKKKISSDEDDDDDDDDDDKDNDKDNDNDDDDEKITSENLSSKIQKFNYKKKGTKNKQSEENDEPDSDNENHKNNGKTLRKGRKRTKADNNTENESDNESDNNGASWGKKHISPTLGNKRPCYAKDGLRTKGTKNKKRKASASNTPDGSEDDDEDDDDEEGNQGDEDGGSTDKKGVKTQEVLRNLSSVDRGFRQAGRNSRRCNYEMQACRNILATLRKHKDAWPFLVAVNVKQAPDYLSVIEKPMDFALVLKNLDDFLYDDILQFVDDIKLVFENSKKYNAETSVVGEAGIKLNEEFQNLLKIHLPEVHATLQP